MGFTIRQTSFLPSLMRSQSRSEADEGARGQDSSGLVASTEAIVIAPSRAADAQRGSYSVGGMDCCLSNVLKIAVP